MDKTKIVLTREDFKNLIAGEIVQKDSAEIALQDIGYIEMYNLIMTEIVKDENTGSISNNPYLTDNEN